MPANSFYKINSELVEHERLNGEVIVISFSSGKYFSLSGSAADIWTLLVEGISLADLITALKVTWKIEIEVKVILEFLAECVLEGIVDQTELGSSTISELPEDHDRSNWNTPKLMIFGNLQDLIMVDPVHDASLIDWPVHKDFEFDN